MAGEDHPGISGYAYPTMHKGGNVSTPPAEGAFLISNLKSMA